MSSMSHTTSALPASPGLFASPTRPPEITPSVGRANAPRPAFAQALSQARNAEPAPSPPSHLDDTERTRQSTPPQRPTPPARATTAKPPDSPPASAPSAARPKQADAADKAETPETAATAADGDSGAAVVESSDAADSAESSVAAGPADVAALIAGLLGSAGAPGGAVPGSATTGGETTGGETAGGETVGAVTGKDGPAKGSRSSPWLSSATTGETQPSAADDKAKGAVDPKPAGDPNTNAALTAAARTAPSEDQQALPGADIPLAPTLPGSTTAPATLAAQGHPATSTATAPFEARLSAALGGSDFAPALGQQISVLVRDGVQHARLHLNPAEMGPITVQIALDGNAAQVNLSADQPLTRQALEQAMPALAGALRDSGLTLTGGGVFEQPRDTSRDRGDGSPGARTPQGDGGSGADGDGDGNAAVAAATRSLRGAVDLIA